VGHRSKKRVLVVEDDEELRHVLRELLQKAGFEVAEARDGHEALSMLRSEKDLDAMVLDLMMPGMDGWQVRAAQLKDPELASTPVVVLTADPTAKAAAIDADVVLEKPFRFEVLLAAISDVVSASERREMSARMAHAERLAALGTMAAGIAHEVNNPLTVVNGALRYAQRALQNGSALEQCAPVLERIEDGLACAERIAKLVKDIAVFARATTPLESLDIAELVRTASAIAASEMVKNDVKLSLQLEPGLVVLADEARLVQVFVNLLVNAAQAVRRDVPGWVEVCSRVTESGDVEVRVTDNGSGIADDALDKIFEPFYTTKPSGFGTGLGLWVSRGIVASFGGHIEVESELGRGTTFRVLLPAMS
jgi:two-component system NtrC family sensor kinase